MSKDVKKSEPRSVKLLAEGGIATSRQCANVLGAIAMDVLTEQITPQVANAACNPIGKMLKLKELEIKHGISYEGGPKLLELTD